MLKIIGWDIGGANIKATRIIYNQNFKKDNNRNLGAVKEINSISKYFPMWDKSKNPLEIIREIYNLLGDADYFSVVMTAELSDRFFSKKEGIDYIISLFKNNFVHKKIFFCNYYGELKSTDDVSYKDSSTDVNSSLEKSAQREKLAAANWAISAKFISEFKADFLLFDMGSTTIDLIPVKGGQFVSKAKTDTERLSSGELIYIGSLRTNIADIVEKLPYRGRFVPVMNEYFASIADVHLIKDIISEKEYLSPTADGRKKDKKSARSRIAKLISTDLNISSASEIDLMADYILSREISLIKEKIYQVFSQVDPAFNLTVLVNKNAEKISPYLGDLKLNIKKLNEEIPVLKNNILTTTASAYLLAQYLKDKDI